jgi:DNA-binding GntR family transcriptional regulator
MELFLAFQLLDLEEMRERAVPQHAAIIKALRDKDGDAAARAMADHVRATGAAMAPASGTNQVTRQAEQNGHERRSTAHR